MGGKLALQITVHVKSGEIFRFSQTPIGCLPSNIEIHSVEELACLSALVNLQLNKNTFPVQGDVINIFSMNTVGEGKTTRI